MLLLISFLIDVLQEISCEIPKFSPNASSGSCQHSISHLIPGIWELLEVQGCFIADFGQQL